mgnify:CR=1 FL=1
MLHFLHLLLITNGEVNYKMDTKRKIEIGDIAKNVSRISEQYQLIHATYACQMLVKQIITEFAFSKLVAHSIKVLISSLSIIFSFI